MTPRESADDKERGHEMRVIIFLGLLLLAGCASQYRIVSLQEFEGMMDTMQGLPPAGDGDVGVPA